MGKTELQSHQLKCTDESFNVKIIFSVVIEFSGLSALVHRLPIKWFNTIYQHINIQKILLDIVVKSPEIEIIHHASLKCNLSISLLASYAATVHTKLPNLRSNYMHYHEVDETEMLPTLKVLHVYRVSSTDGKF